MKKCIITLVGIALLGIGQLSAQNGMAFAMIDLNKVFKDYYKTKEAEADLKDTMSKYREEHQKLRDELQKLAGQIDSLNQQAKDASLSEEARKQKENALREKLEEARRRQREIQEYEAKSTSLFREQSQRMRERILKEITEVVQGSSKGKFGLVLDTSGMTLNGVSPFVYTDPAKLKDITQEVVDGLNAKQPKDGAKPQP